MAEKRQATKQDERELKSKLSFFIVILMVLSLTVCNKPKTQEIPEETPAPTEGTSAETADHEVLSVSGLNRIVF